MSLNKRNLSMRNKWIVNNKVCSISIYNNLINKLVDQIIINTDAADLIINNPLVSHGKVALVERHVKLIGDEVSMNLIIESDLNSIDGDQFLMTHVTNPLVQSETFDRAIRKFRSNLQNGSFDSLFSVNKMQERFYTEEGTPIS